MRVALFLKQRLVESTLGVEARATATKPENKQEILEPVAPCPLCKLIDLFRLHRIGAAPAAESSLPGAMAGLKLLQIGNLSDTILLGLANNWPVEDRVAECLSQLRTAVLQRLEDEQVQVNDPTVFFCFVGSLSAADRGPYAGAGQSLSDLFVEDTRLDFAQRWSLRGFQKYRRDEGRRSCRPSGELARSRAKGDIGAHKRGIRFQRTDHRSCIGRSHRTADRRGAGEPVDSTRGTRRPSLSTRFDCTPL